MRELITIVSLILFFQSCNGNETPEKERLKVKKYSKIELLVNNEDVNSLGYKIWEEDEDVGVKSVCIDSGFIYLTDVYHNNIKKININDKSMVSSPSLSGLSLDESSLWLRDLVVFYEKIYVTSDRDRIYILGKDLKYQKAIKSNKGRKTIFKVNSDSLLIYLDDKQLANKNIKYDLLFIRKTGQSSMISKTISLDEYQEKKTLKERAGKEYRLYSVQSKNFIETQYGIIELKEEIKPIEDYGAYNIDFTDNFLVYFESTPTRLILHIYEY